MISHADIEERFIRAAHTDKLRGMPGRIGPAKEGSTMPRYVHDFADKNGWGSERLAEDRAEFFKALESRCTPRDISEMEECWNWAAEAVTDPQQRRALYAWAASRLPKTLSFKAWCKDEGIHPNTGKNRKNAAVVHILAYLGRWDVQRYEVVDDSMLLDPPVTPYLEPTFESGATKLKREFSWRSDPSLRPVGHDDMRDTGWAEKQNSRRRKRRERAEREKDKAA